MLLLMLDSIQQLSASNFPFASPYDFGISIFLNNILTYKVFAQQHKSASP